MLSRILAIAKSGLPSPLKSPTVTQAGDPPTWNGLPCACVNPPVPLPGSTVRCRRPEFATARSAAHTVPTEVPDGHGRRSCSNRERAALRLCESAGSIAQQHCHGVIAGICNDQVRLTISIEVGNCNGVRRSANWKRAALSLSESAGSIAQQDGYIIADLISDGEVRLAVTVEIPYSQRERRFGPTGSGCRVPARITPVPSPNRTVRVTSPTFPVTRSRLPPPLKLPGHQRSRVQTNRERAGRGLCEPARSVSEQYSYAIADLIPCCKIQVAIIVEVIVTTV